MPTPIPPRAPDAGAVRAPAPDLQAEALRLAERVRREVSRAVDPARIDSELSLLNRFAEHGDVDVVVGPVLAEIVAAALLTARLTSGLVDPTTGAAAWRALDGLAPRPAPGIARLELDVPTRRLRMGRGTVLDLAAVAAAWTADRTVHAFAQEHPGHALVAEVGGACAVGGPLEGAAALVAAAPAARTARPAGPGPGVEPAVRAALVRSGRRGLAVVERSGGVLVDPVSGAAAESPWDRVVVAAPSAVEAQAYARAAHVLGRDAPGWVAACGADGEFTGSRPGSTLRRRLRTPGWPGRGRAAA
ncbi:FAD:protein FMN transferase [Kocuria sp. CPCC 205292]|uniref:FAD:protein FMN transferase n=1 Tax=Kocuria cellulosilytica TaxID=3071451 RepID=UPI0034D41738